MKWGFAGLGAVIVGLFTLMGIYLFLDATIINEEDYYSLKETMEASMYDAIDIDYYQNTGEIKIVEEKFVEVFTRRFIEETTYGKNGYVIKFYDIIESPPKASVRIYGQTDEYQLSLDNDNLLGYDIINELDSILLYDSTHLYTYERSTINVNQNKFKSIYGFTKDQVIIPDEIKDKSNCQIVNVEYKSAMTSIGDLKTFNENYMNWYTKTSGAYKIAAANQEYIESAIKNNSFCQIETVDKFEFDSSTTRLNNPQVTLASSCSNATNKVIAGIKYNITWKCNS